MLGIAAVSGGEFINPPIGEALAFATLQGQRSSVTICHFAGIVAEVELIAVAA